MRTKFDIYVFLKLCPMLFCYGLVQRKTHQCIINPSQYDWQLVPISYYYGATVNRYIGICPFSIWALDDKYRISAVLKVETDMITIITESPIFDLIWNIHLFINETIKPRIQRLLPLLVRTCQFLVCFIGCLCFLWKDNFNSDGKKKSLKIPKGKSESVNRRRAANAIPKRKIS